MTPIQMYPRAVTRRGYRKGAPRSLYELAVQICTDEVVPVPMFVSRFINERGSGGRYYTRQMHIELDLGYDLLDRRVALLHELAHYLNDWRYPDQRIVHGPEFQRQAFDFYERYMPEETRGYIMVSEGLYRLASLREARRRGWAGAEVAYADRRGISLAAYDGIDDEVKKRWTVQ